MLKRNRSWAAAMGLRRPRCTVASRGSAEGQLPPSSPSASASSCVCTASGTAASVPRAMRRSQLPMSSLFAIAMWSDRVVEERQHVPATRVSATAASSSSTFLLPLAPRGQLRRALGTRDPNSVFCATLQQPLLNSASISASAAAEDELSAVLRGATADAAAAATLLCACVAVVLNPSDWPPWVAARFDAAGVVVLPAVPHTVAPSAASAKAQEASSHPPEAWAAVSPLYPLASRTLRRLARELPRHGDSAAASVEVSLLQWLAQLCGVCLAPSPSAAVRLAREVGRVSLDAAGVALSVHCAAQTRHPASAVPLPTEGDSRERRWLQLWSQLTQPSAAPPSLPPFSLAAAVTAGATAAWSAGLSPVSLREARVSWHLHCLVAVKDAAHAARMLSGAWRDAASSDMSRGTSSGNRKGSATTPARDSNADSKGGRAALPLTPSVQAEVLTSFPAELLEADGLGVVLAMSLLAGLRGGAHPQRASFVPAVSQHAVLYARMLRYVLASAVRVHHENSYLQHLHDLTLLLASANVYALAASFVPADEPLTVVMVAAQDPHREGHAQELVSAVRAAIDALCEEPTPQLEEPLLCSGTEASGTAQQGNGSVGSGDCDAAAHGSPRRLVADTRGAASWRWREGVLADVDGAVGAAVRLLTSLLRLCSDQRGSLPQRAAEPKWRRELRERAAVRTHKYELLLQELPHSELRAVLQTLLGHGYQCEGSRLGVSLLEGNQVDLRYYTLPLLGSLYLAVSSTTTAAVTQEGTHSLSPRHPQDDAQEDKWKQAVYRMYRRRFEIYGDADVCAAAAAAVPSPTGSSSSFSFACSSSMDTASTALVRTPENTLVEALVLACTPQSGALRLGSGSSSTAELANCYLNRRATVGGRGVVVDAAMPPVGVGFATWLHKGTISL